MPMLELPVTYSIKPDSYTSIETPDLCSLATYVAENCAGILLNRAALACASLVAASSSSDVRQLSHRIR